MNKPPLSSSVMDVPSSSSGSKNLPYGIYYNEVLSTKNAYKEDDTAGGTGNGWKYLSLYQQMIVELKHNGYVSKHQKDTSVSACLGEALSSLSPSSDSSPSPSLPFETWKKMEEYSLLVDQDSYSLYNYELVDIFNEWGLDQHKEFNELVGMLENK
jgi:hypothetical protein